jgi:hypothetical protein
VFSKPILSSLLQMKGEYLFYKGGGEHLQNFEGIYNKRGYLFVYLVFKANPNSSGEARPTGNVFLAFSDPFCRPQMESKISPPYTSIAPLMQAAYHPIY